MARYSPPLLLAVLVLLTGMLPPCEAEPVDLEPVELAPVTVTETELPPESLVQPSPQAQAETLRQIPGGTNLIDETQYTTGRAATMADMLQGQPGIITGTRGSADEARISIRGSGVDRNYHLRGVRVLLDGMPMNMADGNADFQWIEPLAIRNVEVYRGGNALQYGATTLGGALNFVSPTGYTAPGFQARTESGSFGYLKGQVSSGQVLGNLDYYLSSSAFYQNGFQAHSRSRAQRYSGNIGYRFSPRLETRFYGGLVSSKLQLPGSLTLDELTDRPRVAAPNSLDFDEQHNVRYAYLANKTTWQADDYQQVSAGLYWLNHRLDHPLFWNPFFLNGLGVLDQKTNTLGARLQYSNTRPLLTRDNRFTLGFSPQLGRTEEFRFRNLSGRKRGLKTAHGEMFSANFDLYAEDQLNLWRNLDLVLGGQVSYTVRNYHDRFNRNPNGNQNRNQDYWGVNPKVGLLYRPTPQTQLYANFNRSFEPPTMLEIVQLGGISGNLRTRPLHAQTATTLEVGSRGSVKRIAWDAAVYRSWVRNELLTLNDALGNPLGTLNGSRTVHQGLELGVSTVLADGLLAKASSKDNLTRLSAVGPAMAPHPEAGRDRVVLRQVYDWTHLRFGDDPVYGGNRLPGIPPHLARTELLYEHPCGLYLQPNLEWSLSRFPVDYANTLYARPYAILGLRAGFRSKRGWSAFIDFRNLTNKRYASAVQVVADAGGGAPRVFAPGQGFSVYGGVEWRK